MIHLKELYVAQSFKKWDTTVDGGRMNNASIAELKLLTRLTILRFEILLESFRIMVQECLDLFEKLINFFIIINAVSYSWGSSNILKIDGIHHIDMMSFVS